MTFNSSQVDESNFPFGSYIDSLPEKIVVHMDQKLYDLNNLPPYWPTWLELLPEKIISNK